MTKSDLHIVKLQTENQVFLIIMLFAFALSSKTFAQVDPSSAFLLRSSGKAPTREDLDSSRYQVRDPVPANSNVDDRRLQSSPINNNDSPSIASPLSDTSKNNDLKTPVTHQNLPIGQNAEGLQNQPKETPPKGIVDSVQDALIGGSLESVQRYRSQLKNNDYRLNIVDLNLESLYIYNDSSSNLWMRDYQTSSPGLKVGADIWFTPFFGINTSFQTSMNASVKSSFAGSGRNSVDHEWFDAGIRFRKFFGDSADSAALQLGLDFSEYVMEVEGTADSRMSLKSSGVKVQVETILPTSLFHQWRLGASLMPKIEQQEVDTALSAQSGSNQQSSRWGVSIGSRFIFTRKSQLYWKLSHEVEKNLFEGQSTTNDARTGAPVNGVDVTNGFTIFSIGFTWGN